MLRTLKCPFDIFEVYPMEKSQKATSLLFATREQGRNCGVGNPFVDGEAAFDVERVVEGLPRSLLFPSVAPPRSARPSAIAAATGN